MSRDQELTVELNVYMLDISQQSLLTVQNLFSKYYVTNCANILQCAVHFINSKMRSNERCHPLVVTEHIDIFKISVD